MKYLMIWILVVAFGVSLNAQTPPTENLGDLEAFLNQNEAARHQNLVEDTGKLAAQLSSWASSPGNLIFAYKDAYSFVFFGGTKRQHAQVKDWEEKNKGLFKDGAFQTALLLHVQYLLATLDKKAGEDEKAEKATLQWLESFPKNPEQYLELAKQDLMRQSVADSVFLKAASQTGLAQHLNNWYLGDLTNLPEIHRVNVIGFLRNKKDPQIFEQWQSNMGLEKERFEVENLEAKREYFKNNRKAWLYWQEGKDYALYGKYLEGLNLMKNALMESPKCEDYDQISAEMRRIIEDAKKATGH